MRFDALTLTHGVVERPGWLRTLQASRGPHSAVRPAAFQWQRREGRYISDPYTYLLYAREQRSFFAAHRREPVFPFAVKMSLRLLGDQDIAVSFASMFFSILAVVGTFLLGRSAFSYWIGLGAAAALAVEYEAVTLGIAGVRDDAFTCTVLFSAWALLRYGRIPSLLNAVTVGVVAGIACLVRITALSFLLPGLAWVVVAASRPWRERGAYAAAMVVVAALIAGPFLFNCWRVYGDPFYAINVHADIYRATEGQDTSGASQTAAQYLGGKFRSQPWRTIDTAVLGLTVYPFANKWEGFDRWHPIVGKLLGWAAMCGLFLFVGSREGRLLLIVLAGSLVPYMLTWPLIFDWRFTLHAYPFYLIAACLAFATATKLAHPRQLKSLRSMQARSLRTPAFLGWAAAALVVLGLVWITQRLLPVAVIKEDLRRNESVSVGAGARDRAFFREGWLPAVTGGSVTSRTSEGLQSSLSLPFPDTRDYSLTIRMDPFPRPLPWQTADHLPAVRVSVNGQLLQTVDLAWNPERVGAYTLAVPKGLVKRRGNQLTLTAVSKTGRRARISLWYVRIHPGMP